MKPAVDRIAKEISAQNHKLSTSLDNGRATILPPHSLSVFLSVTPDRATPKIARRMMRSIALAGHNPLENPSAAERKERDFGDWFGHLFVWRGLGRMAVGGGVESIDRRENDI